ncbi:GIY-YIG nuclease family protein [Candidatus Parcubacteria bacterium]|nr:GIY-YIG nuclease family protein [Candidatus Parcubacteria bacterium]
MYYVYFLKNADSKVYVGYTNNLRRRIGEHNRGRGGKYTKYKGPFKLVYYEAYESEKDAKKREDNLKLHKNAYTQLKKRISESLT